jgi:hypothetical protein
MPCQCCCNANNASADTAAATVPRQRLSDDTMVLGLTAIYSLVIVIAWTSFQPL